VRSCRSIGSHENEVYIGACRSADHGRVICDRYYNLKQANRFHFSELIESMTFLKNLSRELRLGGISLEVAPLVQARQFQLMTCAISTNPRDTARRWRLSLFWQIRPRFGPSSGSASMSLYRGSWTPIRGRSVPTRSACGRKRKH